MCENRTGQIAFLIASSLRAIGSLATTRSRSSMRNDFSTKEFTPNFSRVVAASLLASPQRREGG
jgi:hypothetical protein